MTVSALLGVVLLLLAVSVNAQGIYSWNGGVECNTGYVWSSNSSASCWSPSGIPGFLDTIIFPTGTSTTVLANKYLFQYLNNFNSNPELYGDVTIAQFHEVIVQGYLTINASMIINTKSSFNIAKGGTVQTQGYLAGIDGTGSLSVQGTLLMTGGVLFGSGQTVVSAGGLINITTILDPLYTYSSWYKYVNASETFILRNIDIYGTVALNENAIVHWGFWWESKPLTITVEGGGNFTLNGFFSKFFEGNIYSFEIYPCTNPFYPTTIIVNPNGLLNVASYYMQLYHPSIVNNGGIINFNACTPNVKFYPYGVNYTAIANSTQSCNWDCRFSWQCSSPDCYGQYENSNLFGSDSFEIPTEKPVLIAETCEDIRFCRDSTNCKKLIIDLSNFKTHLNCDEHFQFTDKEIIFFNSEEIVVADDYSFFGCTVTVDNVIVYFAREIHSFESTFITKENGEIVFIYLPTSGSDTDAVSYTYYFSNQHFYWEDAFERITFTNSKLNGEITFVSPARIYGSSGLIIQSGSNIFVEREFKSISFDGSGPILVERDATLVLGIEVGVFGDSIVDVFGTLQVNHFSTVTSERPIRLHPGGILNIAGELTATIDLYKCTISRDFISTISNQVLTC